MLPYGISALYPNMGPVA
jgi:hypothetical protein